MEKKRIYFLDYVRVMACLMVMLVHASENFYLCAPEGAPAGEMVDVVSKITTDDARRACHPLHSRQHLCKLLSNNQVTESSARFKMDYRLICLLFL